jgi:hypothetical protein
LELAIATSMGYQQIPPTGYAVVLQKGRSKNFQSRDAVWRADAAMYELASDEKHAPPKGR